MEKVGKALVQSQVKFNKVPEKVLEKIWEASVQSEVGFNRFPEKVLEKFAGNHGAKPSQVQRVPGEGCGEGPGEGFVFFPPGQVKFNRFNMVSGAWLRSTLQNDAQPTLVTCFLGNQAAVPIFIGTKLSFGEEPKQVADTETHTFINGYFRNLNWRYLPNIRPI